MACSGKCASGVRIAAMTAVTGVRIAAMTAVTGVRAAATAARDPGCSAGSFQ